MRRFSTSIKALITAGGLLAMTSVGAQEASPSFSVNGFGTLGLVYSDQDQADFTSGLLAEEGAGYSQSVSAKVDSKAGLQLTSTFASKFKAVLQVTTQQRHDGTFTPEVEWANLSYQVTPEITVRVGRTVLPTFMTSEYRKVGYTTPTVRPAEEVYNLVPITNSDGIDLAYQTRIDDITTTLHLLYGQKRTDLPGGFDLEADNAMAVSNTLEWRDTTLFLSYSQADLTTNILAPLFDGYRAFGAEGEQLAERFDIDNTTIRVIGAGARYDPGDWFITGEWATSRSQSFIGEHRGWYLTGGLRVGSFTPYLSWADLRAKGPLTHPGLPLPPAQALNEVLNQLLYGNNGDQSRLAVGLRWDFSSNMAAKVQYDRLNLRRGTRGLLSNPQPGFDSERPVSLLSATVDFVF